MNHTKIRPLLKEGETREDYDEDDIAGYHMTNKRRGNVYPIGACRHHDPHETKIEAAECYEEWAFEAYYDDGRWQYEEKQRDECVICGEWGRWLYFPGGASPLPMVWACEDHRAKATVAGEFDVPPTYETFGSWSG